MADISPVFARAAMLIDGEWVAAASGRSQLHHDPSTGLPLGAFALAGAVDIDRAIASCQRAFPAWRDAQPAFRRDVLLRAAAAIRARGAQFAAIAARESGAVYAPQAAGQAAEHLVYYAGWADKIEGSTVALGPGAFNYGLLEPYGVVAAINAWNGPLATALMKLGAILAAGNCVVLKAPDLGPFATLLLGEVMLEAGLPPGVLNVVTGLAEAGAALVADPRIGKISFTGGLPTARKVMAAAAVHATPVVSELGGKSANLVFADADLDRAAGMAARMGCLTHAGQGCVLPTRLLVEEAVYDVFVEKVLAIVRAARVGHPCTPGVAYGPLINAAALERVLAVVARAQQQGHGRLLAGGHRLGGELAQGYFMAPTVFGDVDNRSPLAQEEIFGPVLSIIRFSGEAQGLALANDTPFGLAGYIHTTDLERAHRVAARLEAGYISINGFAPLPAPAPFGGYKQSGFGREGGREGLAEFLRHKNVYLELQR
ncbi:MAG TPA: aldehyde dehydrogenase family protein [Novosphingobium sp.]|nr:aldehyde dehydrogenase family protein [Novosphingobium sp.]